MPGILSMAFLCHDDDDDDNDDDDVDDDALHTSLVCTSFGGFGGIYISIPLFILLYIYLIGTTEIYLWSLRR